MTGFDDQSRDKQKIIFTMINNSKRKIKVVKQPVSDSLTRIKVQLDHKTMMVVHSMAAFKMWKKRYPLARVIA